MNRYTQKAQYFRVLCFFLRNNLSLRYNQCRKDPFFDRHHLTGTILALKIKRNNFIDGISKFNRCFSRIRQLVSGFMRGGCLGIAGIDRIGTLNDHNYFRHKNYLKKTFFSADSEQ